MKKMSKIQSLISTLIPEFSFNKAIEVAKIQKKMDEGEELTKEESDIYFEYLQGGRRT